MRVIEASGVELDELHIRHFATGTPAHGDTIAGGDIGVGGVEIDLTRAAARQHGEVGSQRHHVAIKLIQGVQAIATAAGLVEFRIGDEVDRDVLFQQGDIGVGFDALHQGSLYRVSGGVRGVNHPALAVATFAREVKTGLLRRIARERHALINQPLNHFAAAGHDMARNRLVAQTGAGDQGILHMRLDRVIRRQYCGDPALRPIACAVEQLTLGDDAHPALFGQVQSGGQAGQAAAYDQYFE